jgi:hypothetical protein
MNDGLYHATSWDFAYAVYRNGIVSKGPQYHTLDAAQAEADRLNLLIAAGTL